MFEWFHFFIKTTFFNCYRKTLVCLIHKYRIHQLMIFVILEQRLLYFQNWKIQNLPPEEFCEKRCFPVNFVKFLRTPFLQNNYGRVLLKDSFRSLFCLLRQSFFLTPSLKLDLPTHKLQKMVRQLTLMHAWWSAEFSNLSTIFTSHSASSKQSETEG